MQHIQFPYEWELVFIQSTCICTLEERHDAAWLSIRDFAANPERLKQMLFLFFIRRFFKLNLARNLKFCESYTCTHIFALVCNYVYKHGPDYMILCGTI